MLEHSTTSIADSIKQGLSSNAAWLRRLSLVIVFDSSFFKDFDDALDISPLRVTDNDGNSFILDPVISSGGFIANNEYKIVVSFDSDLDEIINIYSMHETLYRDFCFESFFKAHDSIEYKIQESEDTNPDVFKFIKRAFFCHPETHINTQCTLSEDIVH